MSLPMRFCFPLHSFKRLRKRIYLLILALSAFVFTSPVFATVQATDATQDQSGGKNFSELATNADQARQIATTVILGGFALIGVIIAGMSVMALYRAAKEEREKPMGAIVGLVCGAMMTMVPFLVWILHNTLVA